jgi:hypothetical protein
MAERRADRTITITLGSQAEGDTLRLDDFLEELETIRTALRETERLLSGKDPTLYFKIARLEKKSPALVMLEAVSNAEDERALPQFANHVVRSFTTNLRLISKKRRLPINIDMPALESYRELTTPTEKHQMEVQIKTGNHSVLINRHFKTVLESVIGKDEISYGSFSGRIEAINLHRTNRFWLYPIVGPSRIIGRFSTKDRKRFTAAVDKYVTVYGRLRYKTWDKHPYAIWANEIEIHDSDAPKLTDLRGIAPDATGELGTQEYIDRLRHEW